MYRWLPPASRARGPSSWATRFTPFPSNLGQGINTALKEVSVLGENLGCVGVLGRARPIRQCHHVPRPTWLPLPVRPAAPLAQERVRAGTGLSRWYQRHHGKLLPKAVTKCIAPPPEAFSINDGEDYTKTWRHTCQVMRATAVHAIVAAIKCVC